MKTLQDIQHVLMQLSLTDRLEIEGWLREFNRVPERKHSVAEARRAYGMADPPFMTLEEFLEFEGEPDVRYEYVNGLVFAMSGASVAHERIRGRLLSAVSKHVDRGSCEVFSSGMQLAIRRETGDFCYLPDLMVDCRRDGWGKNSVRFPKLVVEILSPSTQHIDRREKFQNYCSIESLEEYVVAAQYERKVTLHRRRDGWRPQIYSGVDAVAELRSIDLTVALAEVYDDIVME